jgi:hypothetical protein
VVAQPDHAFGKRSGNAPEEGVGGGNHHRQRQEWTYDGSARALLGGDGGWESGKAQSSGPKAGRRSRPSSREPASPEAAEAAAAAKVESGGIWLNAAEPVRPDGARRADAAATRAARRRPHRTRAALPC